MFWWSAFRKSVAAAKASTVYPAASNRNRRDSRIRSSSSTMATTSHSRCHQFEEMIGCDAPTTALPLRPCA